MKMALKSLSMIVLFVVLQGGRYLSSGTLTAVYETPVLDGVEGGDWSGDPMNTANGVTLKAAYDDNNFYLLARWNDLTTSESVYKNMWTFDGQSWTQSGDEDRIALMWDLGTAPEGAQCAFMCHPPRMYTSDGTVDLWHWKAHRSNPMGYSDDQYVIAIQDTAAGGETRLGDGGNNTYDDNYNSDPNPLSQAQSDPNADIHFLVRDNATLTAFDPYGVMAAHSVDVAIGWVDAGWIAGSTVAGYVLEIPDGSRADILTAGMYQNGVWTVEFARSLSTTPGDSAKDVQFDPANTYHFSVAIWDNEGDENHIPDPTEHELVFGPTGIGTGRGGPGFPLGFSLSQNYPNPFNPSTTIRYSVPENGSGSSPIRLEIFDLHGRLIRTLVDINQTVGNHAARWDGRDDRGLNLPSGIYLYRLRVNEVSIEKKMTLLK